MGEVTAGFLGKYTHLSIGTRAPAVQRAYATLLCLPKTCGIIGNVHFVTSWLHGWIPARLSWIAWTAAMPYGTLLFYNTFGGLFWIISLSALGYWLGNTIPDIDHYILPILGGIGLLALSPILVRLLKCGVQQRHTRE